MSQRKLTKEEVQLLNKLYDDKDFQFRGFLRKFKIANTYEPKYKVGDFVKVTEYGSRIWGNPVVNVNAKITEIHWFLNDKDKEYICYGCEALDESGRDYYVCAEEPIGKDAKDTGRYITGPSDTDKNYFEKKSEYSQTCPVEGSPL